VTVGNADEGASVGQDDLLALLRRDHSRLGVRIRTLEHKVSSINPNATLRVHYPAFRAGRPAMSDLIAVLLKHMVPFALPRNMINDVHNKYGLVPAHEYDELSAVLQNTAKDLFKKANKAANRNGECGELLLYIMTEWILDAPQLLAKMHLKTNPNMPVHGSDGIHVKICDKTGKLMFIWGESKLYSSVTSAIDAATVSIAEALTETKLSHEFSLVHRNINLSGLSDQSRSTILSYLDPLDEHSNERLNVTTCLIGFDFDGYAQSPSVSTEKFEEKFCSDVLAKLPGMAERLSEAMKKQSLQSEIIEIFFFPVPSVQELRDLFQAEIGWNS
jgi:hypothetical protein